MKFKLNKELANSYAYTKITPNKIGQVRSTTVLKKVFILSVITHQNSISNYIASFFFFKFTRSKTILFLLVFYLYLYVRTAKIHLDRSINASSPFSLKSHVFSHVVQICHAEYRMLYKLSQACNASIWNCVQVLVAR